MEDELRASASIDKLLRVCLSARSPTPVCDRILSLTFNRTGAIGSNVEKADYEAVYAGMTRCSKYSGHDQSAGVPADLPKFTEIKADLEKLSSFVAAANSRRKTLEKEGQLYETGPMAAETLD